MVLNPETQYRDDRNLRARQRLWDLQDPYFDLVGWTLDLAAVSPGQRVLDVGCGNGNYLRALAARNVDAVGCDLSVGMLRAAGDGRLANGDVQALPLVDDSFDIVLVPHMLYHVPDRASAAAELRRVLRPGGVLVAITNSTDHNHALRSLVEEAVRTTDPGWTMQPPSTTAFSLENGRDQLLTAFDEVSVVRPTDVAPVRLTDPSYAADYVASTADHYEDGIRGPWSEVVEHVRRRVQETIDERGCFEIRSGAGALVCR